VGRSLSVLYKLSAPLATGGYQVEVEGYNSSEDAHITAELLLRSSGGADVQLASLDGPPPTSGDGLHSRPWINKTACLTAAGNAGDALVLRVNYLSGALIFGSISTNLKIP
jgi:hypothetical protein